MHVHACPLLLGVCLGPSTHTFLPLYVDILYACNQGIHSATLREAVRLGDAMNVHDLLLAVVDYMGPLHGYWPEEYIDMFFSSHLNYVQRFRLCCFWLHNAGPPYMLVAWLRMRNMLRDASAWMHVGSLLHSYKHDARFTQRYYTYDLTHRRLMHLDGRVHDMHIHK